MVVTFFRLLNSFFTPLGKSVDKKVSTSYYYSRSAKETELIYSRKGNWFEVGANRFNADVKSFKPLTEDIGIDKNAIYYGHKPQPHIDYNTFVISGDVVKDKHQTYVLSNDFTYRLLGEGDTETDQKVG